MTNGKKKNTGFVALHRSITEHWIWEDPVKLKWWLDILMTVNHTETKVNIGYDLYDCKRGQSLNSLQTWAKRWHVDVSTVRRFFNLLQKDKMILTEGLPKTTRLTVCNYDSYNVVQQAKQSQNNFEAIPKQSQDNTNNNVNNENNEKQCERETHSQDFVDEKNILEEYHIQLRDRFPRLFSMAEPLSLKELRLCQEKIFLGHGGQIVFEKVMKAMNDYEAILKRRSTFRMIINWIQNEKQDQQIIYLAQKEHFKNFVTPKRQTA